MKRQIFLLSVIMATAFACSNNNKKASTDLVHNPLTASDTSLENAATQGPYMKFEQNIFDFGTATDGDLVEHNFVFKNEGKTDIIIANASASCGCTVPNYPKNPVKPGDTAHINVVFNTKGKVGKSEKTITILANTIPAETHLSIKGEVLPKQ